MKPFAETLSPGGAAWASLCGSLRAAKGQERKLQGVLLLRLPSHTASLLLHSIGFNDSQDRIEQLKGRENQPTLRTRVAKSLYREAHVSRIERNCKPPTN